MIGTIHPGCAIALQKINWNELDVARAIRDGALASPQQYENMWLFALRITGTGVAYRTKHKEFVFRKPEIYLTPDFLARCNGLPVIVEHPKKATLDSQEYADRNIGSIMLPYIKGDEVWGIARIYDAGAAAMMQLNTASTSPAVVLRKGESLKVGLEDGKALLFEGELLLLDHVAICPVGVWDKGEDPAGVPVEAIGDAQMSTKADATEDKKEEKKDAKADMHNEPAKESSGGESGGQQLDKLLTGLHAKLDDCVKKMDAFGEKCDSVSSRMDAMEEEKKKADAAGKKRTDEPSEREEMAERIKEKEKKKDAEAEQPTKGEEGEARKDRRKDAEAEDKKEEKKEDAKVDAKADSDQSVRDAIADLQKKLPALQASIPMQVSDEDYNTMADIQARADNVFAQLGSRAPRAMNGETPPVYRRRLAKDLQKHSKTWKEIDLSKINDAALAIAEQQIYSDAGMAAQSPDLVPEGSLRAVTRDLPSGHKETRFYGHPSAWMNSFSSNRRYVTKINQLKPGSL